MTQRLRGSFSTRTAAGLLVALYVVLYLLPLAVRPIASPDEVRYAEIPREMIVSGDWVSPHFNGLRYFEKPVLGYWLTAGSMRVFGQTPFGVRLPMALATGLAALILFALARRFISRSAAIGSVTIFLTTALVAGLGTFAVLDALFALFITAALASYYLGIKADNRRHRRSWLMLCGAACGCAFLVKGFIGLAIPFIVVAPYLIVRRRWRTLLSSPWWPIAVAAVVIAPWAIAIQLRAPDYWHYFFWVQNIKRFAGEHAQHAEPIWFYVANFPLLGWPWTALLPAALIGLWQRRRFVRPSAPVNQASNQLTLAAGSEVVCPTHRVDEATSHHLEAREIERIGKINEAGSAEETGKGDEAREGREAAPSSRSSAFLWYTAAWAILPFLFFTFSNGKLQTYILPCFAPLSILLATGLETYLASGRNRVFRIGTAVVALTFIAIIGAIVAGQAGAFGQRPFGPEETVRLAVFIGAAVLGFAAAVFAGWGPGNAPSHRSGTAYFLPLTAIAVAGAITVLPLDFAMPARMVGNVAPAVALERYAGTPGSTLVVSDDALGGTVSWVLKRDDIYMLTPGEMQYGLSYPDSRYRLLTNSDLQRLIAHRGNHAVLIICKHNTAQRVVELIPASASRKQYTKVVVWQIPPLADTHSASGLSDPARGPSSVTMTAPQTDRRPPASDNTSTVPARTGR